MLRVPHLSRLLALLLVALAALTALPAQAAVRITFYSHELGSSFPHAFIVMEGSLERNGDRIEEDYGFTAKTVSPAILLGSVKGEVRTDHDGAYLRHSDRHFTLTLSDEEYDEVMETVERWRTRRQPSYSLGKRNCVHFVAEIAASIGMQAETPGKLMKRPRSYLEYLTQANHAWLEARGATFHRAEPGAAKSGRAG